MGENVIVFNLLFRYVSFVSTIVRPLFVPTWDNIKFINPKFSFLEMDPTNCFSSIRKNAYQALI